MADAPIIVKGLCGRGFYNTGLYLNGVVTPNMPQTDPAPVVEPPPKPLGDPPATPVPPPIEPPPLPAQVQGF